MGSKFIRAKFRPHFGYMSFYKLITTVFLVQRGSWSLMRLGYIEAQRASGERARASSTAVWETAVTQRVDELNKTYINLTQLSFPLPTNRKKWSHDSQTYFLFLTDFRCYCLACDAEIDCRFVEPVFEPVCWLVVPLIFAECGLIDRVGMKFIIVICRTKYLFWNPQIGSVRNSKSGCRWDQHRACELKTLK